MLNGLVVSLVLLLSFAVLAGKIKLKTGGLNSPLVTGVLLGTLIGGSSTIGTAQLAFVYGNSALCFHLGALCGFLLLGFFYGTRIRSSGALTITEIVTEEYGKLVGTMTSTLNCVGTFIAILSQLISATAVLTIILPSFSYTNSLILTAFLMFFYVLFGGTRGAAVVGLLKLVLLVIAMLCCGILAISLSGGFESMFGQVSKLSLQSGMNFMGFFNRGLSMDLGSAFSVLVGIVSTQIYAQAYIMARSEAQAKSGFFWGAFLVPFIGGAGIAVGLFMRVHHSEIVPRTALTEFMMQYLPPEIAGFFLGTLLITVLGSGAGLALSISSILNNDLLSRFVRPSLKPVSLRVLIALTLLTGLLVCLNASEGMILNYTVVSMALRASVILAPLTFAIWAVGYVPASFALVACVCGPAVFFILRIAEVPVNALASSIAVGFGIMIVGWLMGKRNAA